MDAIIVKDTEATEVEARTDYLAADGATQQETVTLVEAGSQIHCVIQLRETST